MTVADLIDAYKDVWTPDPGLKVSHLETEEFGSQGAWSCLEATSGVAQDVTWSVHKQPRQPAEPALRGVGTAAWWLTDCKDPKVGCVLGVLVDGGRTFEVETYSAGHGAGDDAGKKKVVVAVARKIVLRLS